MSKASILTILIVAVIFLSASATIINIPDDYPTIQQGIDVSSDGDTVLVQPDTYVENINFDGHNIVLGSLFLTTGDTSHISQTVIDGDYSGTVVTFENGEDSTATIIGFTLQNGLASRGGGIYCNSSHPTISNNRISGNSAISSSGGGIYCGGGNATIKNNIIIGNLAIRSGGGICVIEYGNAITNNIVIGNSAVHGGGIYCTRSAPSIFNNIISRNLSDSTGAGIFCDNSTNAKIINNIISENSANEIGGGIYCGIYSILILKNSILWADTANGVNNEIYVDSTSISVITFCDIQEGWTGEGNIDTDPLFRDPEYGNFHLMATECSDLYDSPCIDAGHPEILDSLIDCSWGLGSTFSDMGAYAGGESIPHSGRIINIPSDYSTIQAGIYASENGDTVLVQPDTYYENINFNGHNIVLGSLFLTTGDTSYISSTIIVEIGRERLLVSEMTKIAQRF